jgi:hypothetical protein
VVGIPGEVAGMTTKFWSPTVKMKVNTFDMTFVPTVTDRQLERANQYDNPLPMPGHAINWITVWGRQHGVNPRTRAMDEYLARTTELVLRWELERWLATMKVEFGPGIELEVLE